MIIKVHNDADFFKFQASSHKPISWKIHNSLSCLSHKNEKLQMKIRISSQVESTIAIRTLDSFLLHN